MPGQNITTDEQLFSSKIHCHIFSFYKHQNRINLGRVWIDADLENKCILNAFPYLGINGKQDPCQRFLSMWF